MDVLMQSNQQYLNMLGSNYPNSDKKHRFMKYLIYYDVDGGKAIFNELTRSFIWLTNDQFYNVFKNETSVYVDYMWENFFLVNEDFDEHKEVLRIKNELRPKYDDPTYAASGYFTQYTMFTTTACNARCFYCYEKGLKQKPMTSETARKIGEYIIRTAKKNGERLELRWFGGEPLVNENVIDIICKMVQDAGYNYISSITTNGFLFKQEKLDKYRNLWHLNSGQITLDGTEEVYNKTKNYKNVKGKSPYQIVMNNIKMMLDYGMHLAIRMNVDLYNYENIKELIKDIHNKFGNTNLISPYCYPIFEDINNPRTDEESKLLYEHLEELDNILKEYGYSIGTPIEDRMRICHCMVDSGYSALFNVDGNIGLCEHYAEDHFWGHVDKPDMKNLNELKVFQEHDEDTEICKNCPMHPGCSRLKLCADLSQCNSYKKEWHLRHEYEGVKKLYRNIMIDLQNQNNQYNQDNQDNQDNKNYNNEEYTYKKLNIWDKIKIKFNMK